MARPTLKPRGFLLVLCLLLALLLFTLGLSFLGKRAAQYARVNKIVLSAQAKALAEAGLEDFLVKLDRDLSFPQMALGQRGFSYSEPVLVDGARVGSYTVTVDATYALEPYLIWRVRCQGFVGENPVNADASRTLEVEIDLSRLERSDYDADGIVDPNPTYRRVVNYRDLGG